MIPLASNALFVIGLMAVGSWLEQIGGKDGFLDWVLTPLPLGIGGLAVVFVERSIA